MFKQISSVTARSQKLTAVSLSTFQAAPFSTSKKMSNNKKKSNNNKDRFVLRSNASGMRKITLNREKALHALNLDMVRDIRTNLDQWATMDNVGALVINSVGSKAFCAGGDIAQLHNDAKEDSTRAKATEFFAEEYAMNYVLGTYPKPIVSVIDGITMGGGVGLSVHGSVRVGSERTMFAMPETGIGFFPDVGGGFFLSRMDATAPVGRGSRNNALGMYLGLTGARLIGADAYHFGIATHYLEQDLIEQIDDIVLNGLESDYLRENHVAMNKYLHETLADYQSPDIPACTQPVSLIYHCFNNAASVEEIIQRVEDVKNNTNKKSTPEGMKWAAKTLDLLQAASPTSLKVTFKLISEGTGVDFERSFQREFRVASRFMTCPDFFEGVNAKVISKHNNPVWNPSSLSQVSEEQVSGFFELLGDLELELPNVANTPRLSGTTDTRPRSNRKKKARM